MVLEHVNLAIEEREFLGVVVRTEAARARF